MNRIRSRALVTYPIVYKMEIKSTVNFRKEMGIRKPKTNLQIANAEKRVLLEIEENEKYEEKVKMEKELKELFAKLAERQQKYGICDAKLNKIPAQEEVLQTLLNRLNVPEKERVQFMLYF